MSKYLVVVESPAKAKTIKKYLGHDYEVLASYGHVRDLVPKDGAVDVTNAFAMKYQAIERNEKHVRAIQSALRNADGLILASNALFVTEEVEHGRIIRVDLDSHNSQLVAKLRNPEGIGLLPDGNLVVSEDLQTGGRVVTVDKNGRTTPLVSGQNKPEGLAIAKDDAGWVYISGQGRDRILRLRHVS